VRTINDGLAMSEAGCSNTCLVACAPLCIITFLIGSYISYSFNQGILSDQAI